MSFNRDYGTVSLQQNNDHGGHDNARFQQDLFHQQAREAFRVELMTQGIDAIIVSERDYLNVGGTLYYVKWNRP